MIRCVNSLRLPLILDTILKDALLTKCVNVAINNKLWREIGHEKKCTFYRKCQFANTLYINILLTGCYLVFRR